MQAAFIRINCARPTVEMRFAARYSLAKLQNQACRVDQLLKGDVMFVADHRRYLGLRRENWSTRALRD